MNLYQDPDHCLFNLELDDVVDRLAKIDSSFVALARQELHSCSRYVSGKYGEAQLPSGSDPDTDRWLAADRVFKWARRRIEQHPPASAEDAEILVLRFVVMMHRELRSLDDVG